MYFLYSSSVVAPIQCSSPRASLGLSRLPASIAPSVLPAPTMLWISSMKRMILPSDFSISFNTAFRRSSNSPLNLAPAISAPISSAKIVLSFRPSGTSPFRILCASPSTTAVLPTPGSPISTGLFLVLLERIWMVCRISLSRPITGSSLPSLAISTKSRPYLLRASYPSSGFWLVTRWLPLTFSRASRKPFFPILYFLNNAAEGVPFSSSSARYICSTLTYSSLNSPAIFSALSKSCESLLDAYMLSAAAPVTFGNLCKSASKSPINAPTFMFMNLRSFGISPSCCITNARCRCSPSSC